MLQVIEQTDKEKMAMYMKVPKEKLAEMVIECNKHLEHLLKKYKAPKREFEREYLKKIIDSKIQFTHVAKMKNGRL